jgi:hypothetical protein
MAIAILILIALALGYLYYSSLQKMKALQEENKKIAAELLKYAPIKDLQAEIAKLKNEIASSEKLTNETKERLAKYEFELDLHELGFYQPKFQFDDILKYVEALDLVREAQKELIRQKKVFELQGLLQTSKLMNKDVAKLAVSAFNGEVSAVVETVRYDNYEKCKEQVCASYEKINSLIQDTGLKISSKYLELKIKELALIYDFKEAERKAKEEQAELKAAMREEEQARIEAEKVREKAIKEQEQYQAALEQARMEMQNKSEEERAKYEAQIVELQKKYEEATAERERATAMAQITKKGHVYIISNIGSFGENVLKIGMTRRTDPKERIKELGDASVPFEFDIHALISTDDAPALENALHLHFENMRINKVNPRKEFFSIAIDEVASACEKLGCQVKLTKLAEAREYRESQRLSEMGKST